MNRDEQKQILALIDRAVNDAQDALVRPVDIEADAIIRALFVRNPEAAYRVTMLAIAQAQEIESLQAALSTPEQSRARGFLARVFNPRALSESSHARRMRILQRPVSG